MSLESLRNEHRRWLGRHALLDRPWFVLGSAPDPTIPERITTRAALVCINNAAATAHQLGLPSAALNLRAKHKEWQSVRECTLPAVLLVSNNPFDAFVRRRFYRKPKIGEIRSLSKRSRRTIYTHFLGDELRDIGQKHKPSMGIFAVLYGLFVEAPQIILSGVSTSKEGYSYGPLPGIQKHREEDMLAMRKIGRLYRNVLTTERDLSDETGIPLYSEKLSSDDIAEPRLAVN